MVKNHKRVIRASTSDLAKGCVEGRDCPADIKDIITQNTWADWILRFLGLGVYFGDAGIGTGVGGGGAIPGRVVPGIGVDVGVPSIPVVPRVPTTIGAGETTVVEVPVEIPMVDLGIGNVPRRLAPTIHTEETPVDFGLSGVHRRLQPTLITGEGEVLVEPPVSLPTPEIIPTDEGTDTVAVVDVRPGSTISRQQFDNPLFDVSITATNTSGETSSADHIFVTDTRSPNIVGLRGGFGVDTVPLRVPAEEIELQDLTVTSSEFDIPEETQFASTPKHGDRAPRPERISRFTNRRRLMQRRIDEPEFLSRPEVLVRFDNPAYEADVDLIFTDDLEELHRGLQPPHEDFRDIVTLSAPIFSAGPEGGLRVSRIGQRASIVLRSGLHIGEATHFYRDLSSIAGADPLIPEEAIELTVLGESSGDTVIANGLEEAEFVSIDLNEEPETAIYQGDLLDDFSEFTGVEEIAGFIGEEDENTRVMPAPFPRPFPGEAPGNFISVFYPEQTDGRPPVRPDDTPWITITPSTPRWSGAGEDFYLHPALLRRRKRRKHCYYRSKKCRFL